MTCNSTWMINARDSAAAGAATALAVLQIISSTDEGAATNTKAFHVKDFDEAWHMKWAIVSSHFRPDAKDALDE